MPDNDPIKWKELTPNQRNALIAEHIFGRKIVAWSDGRDLLLEREGMPGLHESVPAYTESMDAAWTVLQKMAGHENRAHFMHLLDKGELASKSNLEFQLWEILKEVATWTPAMISVAALRALGLAIEIEEGQ